MEVDKLLAITPEALAKAILHRRERLAEVIPEQLEAKIDEKSIAEEFARDAKLQRDELNEKVARIKSSRNNSQAKAKALFEQANSLREQIDEAGGYKNPEPEWKKEKLQQKLEQLEFTLETNWGDHKTEGRIHDEMKRLIRQHEQWVEDRSASQPLISEFRKLNQEAVDLINQAEQFHQEMLIIVQENEKFHSEYLDKEFKRRNIDSKTKQLSKALQSSEIGIEHWQRICDGEFKRLLVHAERVRDGGTSTVAQNIQRKKLSEAKQTGGEEE